MRVSRPVITAEAITAAIAAVGIVMAAPAADWDIALFGVLFALATLSDLGSVEVSSKLRVSGSFVALVLAMVLLGAAPAALLGAGCTLVSWLWIREPAHALRANVITFALWPLAGGVFFAWASSTLSLDSGNGSFYLLVLAAFILALVFNFVLVAAYGAAIGRATFGESVREALIPLLASELITALLTVAAVFLYEQAGIAAIGFVGVAVLAFQHLLKELLVFRQRAHELEDRTLQLHSQALTDELTGLGNRRRLMEDLETRVAEASPERPLLLAVFDLDGFKQYNDAFGHPDGDLLLRRLGVRLNEAVAHAGTAYRPGGDEFCILAFVDREEAPLIVDAATEALWDEGGGFEVSSSSGAVILPDEATGAADGLRLADQRMYARKESRPASAKRQARDVLLTILAEQQPDLHDHLSDVGQLAVGIARELGMSDDQVDDVARAAELHDVGKIAIPAAILSKPGPLDEDEWVYMRRHTLIGERMLLAAPALRGVAALVRSSHERWDGTGYPDGLSGDAIPIGARIITVCDAYDAMRARRPYNRSRGETSALRELERCSGTHFDPVVVEAFLRHREAAKQADVPLAATLASSHGLRGRAGGGR